MSMQRRSMRLPADPPADKEEARILRNRKRARACGYVLDDYTPALDPLDVYQPPPVNPETRRQPAPTPGPDPALLRAASATGPTKPEDIRMNKALEFHKELAALIECAYCGAKRGEFCKKRGGTSSLYVHAARVNRDRPL
jgi:hypothetical protein